MIEQNSITVVIPCYRVREQIGNVLNDIPEYVDHIIVVDDACPERSFEVVEERIEKESTVKGSEQGGAQRIELIKHKKNLGVGGAMKNGYRRALELQSDIIVKMDGDGQMKGSDIAALVDPIINQQYDYTKGNRFYDLPKLKNMPKIRLIGNSLLSFVTKMVSGYWHLMDSTNGFTAIRRSALQQLPLNGISSRYFFETDMLVNLYLNGTFIKDVPTSAHYADEKSNMIISKILLDFPPKILTRLAKRILYRYFLYDFNMASVYLTLALPMITFGTLFGSYHWMTGAFSNTFNSAGTVMLAAMPTILGVQFLLQAIQIDITNTPRKP